MLKHAGTNPASKATGKYVCQEGMNSHNNYGTSNFTAAKQANRRADKQVLRNITQYEDFDTDC